MRKTKNRQRKGDLCPECKVGYFIPTDLSVKGYPVEECSYCNAFALLPVAGREPPMHAFLRALHDVGCEPGMDGDGGYVAACPCCQGKNGGE